MSVGQSIGSRVGVMIWGPISEKRWGRREGGESWTVSSRHTYEIVDVDCVFCVAKMRNVDQL